MTRLLVWFLAVLSATTVLGGYPPRRRVVTPRPAPSKDTYFISAPNTVIPGTNYAVTVDILNGTEVEVTAGLQESVYNGTTRTWDKVVLKTTTGVFSKSRAGRLEIPLDESFRCRSCQLIVQGRGGQVFERANSVAAKQDILSIFIQTDKAIYKPGQKVRYRAFAVYQDLQLYKGSFSIEIREPSGNRMQVQTGLRDQSAVVEGYFNLSDQPPFGDWSIQVSTGDAGQSQSQRQTFTVAQYELPRFEVTVDLPPFALLHETDISGTVTAKYTYGKPVKGMVDLHVGPDQGPDYCGKMPKTVNIGFEIDGEGTFNIPKSNIQRVLSIHHGTRVRFTAIVTEDATGIMLNGSSSIQYYTELHSMNFLSSTPNVFKPGLPYTAHVQVKKPDGSPPTESSTVITVWPYAESRTTVPNQSKYGTSYFTGTFPLPPITLQLPANGIVSFNIDIPSNATQIWIKAYYGSLSVSKNVQKTYSPSNNYMQLTMLGHDIKSGDKTVFQVQATEGLDTINYEIISRKSITKVGTVGALGQSTFTFDVDITEDMGPVADLLVYYVRDSGEVVADSISFNVDGIFKNKVSVDFSAERAEPNNNIQLKVKADPMSKVYLLAVDESVLLLKSGNDISTSKVQSGVSDQQQMASEYAQSQSATNIGEVFTKSGLIVITDATLHSVVPRPPNSFGRRISGRRGRPNRKRMHSSHSSYDMDFDGAGEERGFVAPDSPLKEVKRVRNTFPEAWLWTDAFTK